MKIFLQKLNGPNVFRFVMRVKKCREVYEMVLNRRIT